MHKIASPVQLAEELSRISAYCNTVAPSRDKIAEQLRTLADGVESEGVKRTAGEDSYEENVKNTWLFLENAGHNLSVIFTVSKNLLKPTHEQAT